MTSWVQWVTLVAVAVFMPVMLGLVLNALRRVREIVYSISIPMIWTRPKCASCDQELIQDSFPMEVTAPVPVFNGTVTARFKICVACQAAAQP